MNSAQFPLRCHWPYPKIVAHRCGGALAPENTLAGLIIAARLGMRAVEFDVMLSEDGVPVLIHDETLERTTNGCGPVDRMPAEQLLRLDAGLQHHRAFRGELLPSLQQVLETCLRLGLLANIEIKPAPGHETITGEVVAGTVVDYYRRTGRAAGGFGDAESRSSPWLLSSFSMQALQAAGAIAPEIERALLVEAVPTDWQARMQAVGAVALHCAASDLNADVLVGIRAEQVLLACYTVNSTELATALFAQGVGAVFTDRIDLFHGSGVAWSQAGAA
jgi:glycerophosphoryl diester phosphodiesterase